MTFTNERTSIKAHPNKTLEIDAESFTINRGSELALQAFTKCLVDSVLKRNSAHVQIEIKPVKGQKKLEVFQNILGETIKIGTIVYNTSPN